MNEIDILQYNSQENTEQSNEKPKRKKTLLQMQALKKHKRYINKMQIFVDKNELQKLKNIIKKLKNQKRNMLEILKKKY